MLFLLGNIGAAQYLVFDNSVSNNASLDILFAPCIFVCLCNIICAGMHIQMLTLVHVEMLNGCSILIPFS